MIAAAKLRRAQNNMLSARPYSHRLRDTIAEMAARTTESHPLLEVRDPKNVGFVVVASDRGMAGSFNANVIKHAVAAYKQHENADNRYLITVGRKTTDFFTKRGYNVISKHLDIFPDPTLESSRRIGERIIDLYKMETLGLDRVYLVYNEFKNVAQQQVIVEQLLPVVPAKLDSPIHQDFEFEPDPMTILDVILPQYIDVEIWHVLLESFAAEMAARMTAMENATKAATDLIKSLTLQYNKARQGAITKELLEIVGGAEALKG